MGKYRNVSRRRLEFPDHQIVLPGETFERVYTPEMEFHHKVAGIIEELVVEDAPPLADEDWSDEIEVEDEDEED